MDRQTNNQMVYLKDRQLHNQCPVSYAAAHFNPYLPSGPVHPYQPNKSISNLGVSDVFFIFYSVSDRYIPVGKQ